MTGGHAGELEDFENFFDSLPCAAWIFRKPKWHVGRGNLRAAAYMDGKRQCTSADLDGLLELQTSAGSSIAERVAAAFSSPGEASFPASLRSNPDSSLTLACWPLPRAGDPDGVALLVLEGDEAQTRGADDWSLRIGHDLRGPITPIRMAVQLLKGGRVSPVEQRDALDMIDRQLDYLLGSVQDLSDLLRAEAGLLSLNARPEDLNLVVDLVAGRGSLLRVLEDRRQVLQCVPWTDAMVASHDPGRLAAMLEYLVCKSAEHAPDGSVLTLVLQPDEGHAVFTVSGGSPSILADADLAEVAGWHADGFGQPTAKAVLMHEIARLSHADFAQPQKAGALAFSLPLPSPPQTT